MDVNIGGVWKSGVSEHVNIGGVWKQSAMEYVNIGGVWKYYNPYGKVNLASTVFRATEGSYYSAGWVTGGYQMSLTTSSNTDDGTDRLYVGTGAWNWTLDPSVDKFEMTFTINTLYSPSGTVQAGIVEKIPGANGYYWHADIGAEFTLDNDDYTNTTMTVTKQSYSNVPYYGSFYLIIDSYDDYSVITVTFHSVKLNGIEILM